jgi:hypothetical protein
MDELIKTGETPEGEQVEMTCNNSLEKEVASLKAKLSLYEENGSAKLYYSLQRKMNEMANLMNRTNLETLDIDDPKSKSFDRLKVIWNDAASIAAAVKSLGEVAGVTGDEKKDVERKPFVDRIAEKRY